MKHPPLKMTLFFRFMRAGFIAAAALAMAIAPMRTFAQAQAPETTKAPAITGGPSENPAAESSKADENQDKQFLYSPIVQSIARALHLNTDTAVLLFLGVNFAIIFFAIAIPLGRSMPKVIRKRTQTLSQDLRTAREATADAQSRLKAVETKLAGLGTEIEKFRAEVEQEAQEDEKRIKASIAEESARIVTSAEQEIGVAVAQAKRGLRSFAADLAIEQASKQVALTPEIDHALINEFIAGVAAEGVSKGGQN